MPDKVLRSELLLGAGVVHGFTTRHAGNLGFGNRYGDPEVIENRSTLFREENLTLRRHVQPKQVHSTRVVHAAEYISGSEADAVYTHRAHELLSILTADCLPVLLYHSDGFVAAVHAGWRGLFNDIIPLTLETLRPGPIAAIGPCIRVCCYEVSDSLASEFAAKFGNDVVQTTEGAKPHLDLIAVARKQLSRNGVQKIDDIGRCTFCDPDFFSYRRDGSSGRQMSFIGIR